MSMKTLLVISLLALSGQAIAANADIAKPLDDALQTCKNNANSTLETADCYQKATQAWDKMLNVQYQALLSGQSEAFKQKMKISQRGWIKYKEDYFSAMESFYQQQQGTIWGLVAAESKLNVIRDKALDLYRLRNSTNMEG
jgi:uncharacterized protein YecT (DUF1311 family)